MHAYNKLDEGTSRRLWDDYFEERATERESAREERADRRRAMEINGSLARRAQNYAAGAAVFFGALTVVLATGGHETVAVVTAGTTIVGTVTALVGGRLLKGEDPPA